MTPNDVGATVWRAGLHAAALAAVLLVLWRAAPFLKLAAVAAVLASALESPVSWLERHGWRRGFALALVGVSAVAVVAASVALLVPRVAPQVQEAIDSAPALLERMGSSSEYRWLNRQGVFDRALDEARQHAGAAIGSVVAVASGFVSFGAGVVTVIAMTAFLLASGPSAWRWLLAWVSPSRRHRVARVGRRARRAVAGYVAGALVMGGIAGGVTALTTALLGVPFFLPLAMLTAALGIVPFIGAIVSGVLVVGVTLATSGQTAAVIALCVFAGYQQLEGSVLQPLVQRHTTSMNGLVVLIAVLVGTSALGLFGGIIALPVAAAGKVAANEALRHRRATRRRGPLPHHPDRAAAPPPPRH